jgi:hypothetical protein
MRDDDIIVTEEELRALLDHHEVSDERLKGLRPIIYVRSFLVAFIIGVRVVIAIYFPEYLAATIYNEQLLDSESLRLMVQLRLILAFVVATVYIYSLHKNFYFRSVNVALLVIFSSLFWSDLESIIFPALIDLTYPSIVMVLLRVVPLIFIIQNYRDLRQA